MSYVLGINCVYHELSAALLKDGQLVAYIEEERLTRIKHGKLALIDNPDQLPFAAIEHCLRKAGIGFGDIESIGTSIWPEGRLRNVGADSHFVPGEWSTEEGEKLFVRKLHTIPGLLDTHFRTKGTLNKFHWVPHHEAHAASAFLVSPYKEAAIISVDGIGEFSSTWLGHGKGTEMNCIKDFNYPNSLGFLWEKLCKFIGFSEHDACKVMGLASYGNSNTFEEEFKTLVDIGPEGAFAMNNQLLKFRIESYDGLEALFRTPRIHSPDQLQPVHQNIAAGLQKITNQVLLNLAGHVAKVTGSKNLCMAGGVALNCVANTQILSSGLFKNVYIQPAAHDAGTALGSALYIWNYLKVHPRRFEMSTSYTSAEFTDAEVKAALDAAELQYEKMTEIEDRVAEILAEGDKIVGWFQGGMEWGPRALGNRSLLTDPRNRDMREILNIRIKKREPFRPFAPSVLAEEANAWFDMPSNTQSPSKQFMIFTFPVKSDKLGLVPAVVHVDGTSRPQLVTMEANPRYHKLISAFNRRTGIPMLLNTSFNDNEPIVCTPQDAIRTFTRTRMEYLVLHNFLVRQTQSFTDS